MSTHKDILLHLSLIDGIGPFIIQHISKRKPADLPWQDLYRFSLSDWMQLAIPGTTAQKMIAGLQSDILSRELALLDKNQIAWTTVLDSDYPALLAHIHLPPPVLYWRGILPSVDAKNIAVVGSRKADGYGKRAIDLIIPTLVQYGITIVSGGAVGADSMAHRTTLEAHGKTVVVLGSGLLCPYPRENKKLFDQILERGGAVLSSFPLNTVPHPGNFPARNRIIAGLSLGVIVVQAARKSGARITAQFALEQGRDVFAIPGPIDNELSDGCHALVQEGAKLITGPADVLQELGIVCEQTTVKAADAFRASDPLQERIVQLCIHPQSLDELTVSLAVPLPELQAKLFELHVAGLIEQDFMGLWKSVL